LQEELAHTGNKRLRIYRDAQHHSPSCALSFLGKAPTTDSPLSLPGLRGYLLPLLFPLHSPAPMSAEMFSHPMTDFKGGLS